MTDLWGNELPIYLWPIWLPLIGLLFLGVREFFVWGWLRRCLIYGRLGQWVYREPHHERIWNRAFPVAGDRTWPGRRQFNRLLLWLTSPTTGIGNPRWTTSHVPVRPPR